MYKFKIGDWVRITKPTYTEGSHYWACHMDRCDGRICRINDRYIINNTPAYNVGNSYPDFSEKWLEKVTCDGDCINCNDKICKY